MIGRRPLAGAIGAALIGRPHAATARIHPPTLAALASSTGLVFGTAMQIDVVASDPAYAALIGRQAAMVTPENELKWHRLRPSPTTFDFAAADRLLDFAARRSLAVRGHTLVWHVDLPDWLLALAQTGPIGAVVDAHILAVVGRTRGRIPWWDVVNEPICVEDGAADGLRRSVFLERLGPGYIAHALRVAHASDPAARLVINEMDVECVGPYFAARRQALLALLTRLRDQGVPLHAVGIQSHLKWERGCFDPDTFRRFLERLAALGLDIHLTEFDVADLHLAAAPAPRDRAVADLMAAYLATTLDEPAVKLLTVWGLTDRHSWLDDDPWTRRADGLRSRGCLFDDRLRPKPARDAVAAALRARARPT